MVARISHWVKIAVTPQELDHLLKPQKSFQPVLHASQVTIDPTKEYAFVGMHLMTPANDAMHQLPNPIAPVPNEPDHHTFNRRYHIRLHPEKPGAKDISVTYEELKFFDDQGPIPKVPAHQVPGGPWAPGKIVEVIPGEVTKLVHYYDPLTGKRVKGEIEPDGRRSPSADNAQAGLRGPHVDGHRGPLRGQAPERHLRAPRRPESLGQADEPSHWRRSEVRSPDSYEHQEDPPHRARASLSSPVIRSLSRWVRGDINVVEEYESYGHAPDITLTRPSEVPVGDDYGNVGPPRELFDYPWMTSEAAGDTPHNLPELTELEEPGMTSTSPKSPAYAQQSESYQDENQYEDADLKLGRKA